jgi:hypothetical protein
MPRIATQDFTLTRDDCRPLYFKAGDSIPAEYENHFWVLPHSDETQAEAVPTEDKRRPGRPSKA